MTAAISLGIEPLAGALGSCLPFWGPGAACTERAITLTMNRNARAAPIVLEAFIFPPVRNISFTSAFLIKQFSCQAVRQERSLRRGESDRACKGLLQLYRI